MESPELPECPVCLQVYDGDDTIPLVLACGHSACKSCLRNIPEKYPQTIRCPACTQLVKYPSKEGPSSLPKNIDLLRLISPQPNHTKPRGKSPNDQHPQLDDSIVSRSWSDELYATWKKWVLPKDAVLIEGEGGGEGVLREQGDRKVRLFKVGSVGFDANLRGSVFNLSYRARILSYLNGMKEKEREELGLVLGICSRQPRVCKVYGLWGDLEGGNLYIVYERLKNGSIFDNLSHFKNGSCKDVGLSSFALVSMEICEAMVALHLEGLTAGCLGLSCFEFDDFGHVNLSLSEVWVLARSVRETVIGAGSCGRSGSKNVGILVGDFLKNKVFVSPEVLLEILKEDMELKSGAFGNSVGQGSDVWALAFILLTVLIGEQFIEVLVDHLENTMSTISEENNWDDSFFYTGLPEKVNYLLESKFGEELESLQGILCRCLNFDPASRPFVIDLWKCTRELISVLKFDTIPQLEGPFAHEERKVHCLMNGELCRVLKEKTEACKEDELQVAENSDGEDMDQAEEVTVDKNLVEGLVEGNVKFENMQGHRDCVTGLAIGGGFLFSSSFDKSVHVWSLQDFSHVHTLKGHEHKVMAVAYVDEGQPLCVSADSGGGIFVWDVSMPLGQEPLQKWYEQADWRYSGIHALTTAGNGCLYTGSGDRTIKKWLLQDGTLSCTMEGHKSVVSTLAASNGVLYSGSWDGTIRLWSLSDHSLLTVLGWDVPGTMTSVQSIITNGDILVAGHENGHIKVWRNDVFMKSIKLHNGSIFALGMEGKWLFTGGWDRTINVQEISGDEFQVDIEAIGSIPGGSVVTALLCWQGLLFVGYGDRSIKVFHNRK